MVVDLIQRWRIPYLHIIFVSKAKGFDMARRFPSLQYQRLTVSGIEALVYTKYYLQKEKYYEVGNHLFNCIFSSSYLGHVHCDLDG